MTCFEYPHKNKKSVSIKAQRCTALRKQPEQHFHFLLSFTFEQNSIIVDNIILDTKICKLIFQKKPFFVKHLFSFFPPSPAAAGMAAKPCFSAFLSPLCSGRETAFREEREDLSRIVDAKT